MNGTWEQSDHYDMRKGVNFYSDWHKVIYTMQLLKWFKVQAVLRRGVFWIWKVIYKNWNELELRVLKHVHFANFFYFVQIASSAYMFLSTK